MVGRAYIVALVLLPCTAAYAFTAHRASPRARSRSAIACDAGPITVQRFLEDLEFLGPCRFVVLGPGAIRARATRTAAQPRAPPPLARATLTSAALRPPAVEAVGAFEDLRTNDKGLATVSTDTGFECHIKLAEVKRATFAKKDSGDKTLHIVRLLGGEGQSLLSAILSPETPGEEVEEGAVEYYERLRARFGDELELVQA